MRNDVIEFGDACKNAALHPGSGTRVHFFVALLDPDKNHEAPLVVAARPERNLLLFPPANPSMH